MTPTIKSAPPQLKDAAGCVVLSVCVVVPPLVAGLLTGREMVSMIGAGAGALMPVVLAGVDEATFSFGGSK
jgi:hypothetical protein